VGFRPGYTEYAPPPGLTGAVACTWMRVAGAPGDPPTRVLPDTCADLIWRAGSGAFVAGPDTGPVLARSAPGELLVGIRLAPGAGGAALGLPLRELRDRRVALADLDAGLDARLPGDLDPRAVHDRLLAAVARRLAVAAPDRLVAEASRRLRRPGVPVETLAADLGVSERQLRRRFDAAAGYGPKTLHRVLRFRAALAHLDAADLARLAQDTGYADQAHLTRECTRLAGLPPAALARERRAATA
jgi:AraC-like DNA-binding protein